MGLNPDFPHHEYRWRGLHRVDWLIRFRYDKLFDGCDLCSDHWWDVEIIATDFGVEEESIWRGSVQTDDEHEFPSAARIWEAMLEDRLGDFRYCCKASPQAVAVKGTK